MSCASTGELRLVATAAAIILISPAGLIITHHLLSRMGNKPKDTTILQAEKQRLKQVINGFMKDGGAIIALQKDAHNAVSKNQYNLSQATEGILNIHV